ncbi:hypothetical protein NIM87_00075 [Devosia sp. XJ19-1]|uniref:DUF2134 domain-containing protein n=1 Tax=Devosia ureilytica TaxID=2952754 RepID=A0A9Q4AMA5_9HYPH|nr:hypothetical protein [Devosia ureilytica]MCP8881896.1 hypothetical protein [Devosia ureilytica]MCP8886218.1 hypothetical protein [Devosia ureilytica]
MSMYPATRGRVAVLASACLLSVALPAGAGLAKEKVKAGQTAPAAHEMDYSVSIPTIDAVGSNVSDAVLTDILGGNVVDNAGALAGLDATSITVPEIIINVTSQTDGEKREAALTFTDLLLEDVIDGQAKGISLGGMSLVAEDVTLEVGAMSAANFDIAGVLGIYGLVDAAGQTEMQTIYTDLISEGGTLKTDEVSCTVGGVTGAEFKARPLKTSFAEMMSVAQSMEDNPDDPDPALVGRFLKMYADILTAFETSEVSFDGMNCDGVDDDGKAMTFGIAGMSMGGMSPGIYPSISMDGFDITVENDGSMSLDNLTIKPMDLSTTIATLEGAPDLVDEAWFEQNARALIPAMEGITFSGFAMDIPNPDKPTARIQAKVGAFDLSLANYLNGIPTALDISASKIEAEVPADTGDESLEQLRALGITNVDAGFRVAATWDEASDSIAIEEVSLSGVDLATVLLAGTVTNATAELFALDENAAMAAGMGLAIRDLDLTVTDSGLSDIILAVVAAEQGADPATLRPVFAGLAQGTVIGMMAGAADAAKLGDAINSFISGTAKTLMIGIDAKTEPGLSMMDFMQAEEDPTSLLGKVNISAEAK